jgi:hypothetical protein
MQQWGHYGYYSVDTVLVKFKVFIVLALICIHTSGLDMFDPEESSPCDVCWCVLCIMYSFIFRSPEGNDLIAETWEGTSLWMT